MDEKNYLILIKGENKTRQIEQCYYDRQTQRYLLTFTGGKTYTYLSIKWLREPKAYNPSLYKISKGNIPYSGIRAIFVFQDTEEWWYLVFDKNSVTCRRSELSIEQQFCIDKEHIYNKLKYLKEIADLNELKNAHGEVLLQKQYEYLPKDIENSALAAYLYPEIYHSQNNKKKLKKKTLKTKKFCFFPLVEFLTLQQNFLMSILSYLARPFRP